MTLRVIGSGFGRTGTKSMKEAIELLAMGPCHHMYEVVDDPDQLQHWQALAAGEPVDWTVFTDVFKSQVDWPGAHFWREMATEFPEAKVLHTVRPEENWWKSFSTTIGKLLAVYRSLDLPPHIRTILDFNHEIIAERTFGGQFLDRDSALAAYRRRTEEVQNSISPDRLLVFDVAQGWEPLCDFLDVPVPNEPFPHHNLRADFWEVLGGEPD